MDIPLVKLNCRLLKKPLLIGGFAKEYYGIRKAGSDVDLVVSQKDYEQLAQKYPKNLKDLVGDLGVCVAGFEIWKTVAYYNYEFLSENAVEEDTYKVISLEKLLYLTALAMNKPKYRTDLQLIVDKILELQSARRPEV